MKLKTALTIGAFSLGIVAVGLLFYLNLESGQVQSGDGEMQVSSDFFEPARQELTIPDNWNDFSIEENGFNLSFSHPPRVEVASSTGKLAVAYPPSENYGRPFEVVSFDVRPYEGESLEGIARSNLESAKNERGEFGFVGVSGVSQARFGNRVGYKYTTGREFESGEVESQYERIYIPANESNYVLISKMYGGAYEENKAAVDDLIASIALSDRSGSADSLPPVSEWSSYETPSYSVSYPAFLNIREQADGSVTFNHGNIWPTHFGSVDVTPNTQRSADDIIERSRAAFGDLMETNPISINDLNVIEITVTLPDSGTRQILIEGEQNTYLLRGANQNFYESFNLK